MSPPASSTTSAVAEDAVDVILREGTTLRLRPPTAADADALLGCRGIAGAAVVKEPKDDTGPLFAIVAL